MTLRERAHKLRVFLSQELRERLRDQNAVLTDADEAAILLALRATRDEARESRP